MAISKGSALNRDARSFTLTIEEYTEEALSCVLFEGEDEKGHGFDSFYKLVDYMEQCFESIQYPKASVIKRSFGTSQLGESRKCEGVCPGVKEAGRGRLGTFRIWVRHCQHASWQGELEWLDRNERIFFHSFLDLLICLDQILTGRDAYKDSLVTSDFSRLKLGLDLMGKGAGKQRDHGQLMENMMICRQIGGAGKSTSFTVRALFCEHHSFQGSLNWNEGRKTMAFRSFLELIQLMESADDWAGRTVAVS